MATRNAEMAAAWPAGPSPSVAKGSDAEPPTCAVKTSAMITPRSGVAISPPMRETVVFTPAASPE